MTFVEAHTNAPGNWTETSGRTETSAGVVYDAETGTMVPYSHVDAIYWVTSALSKKPPIFHWDHKTSTDYNRGVSRIMQDSPIIRHSHYVNPVDGITANYDYLSTEYISKLHTPFSVSPVNGPIMDNVWDQAVNQALISIQGQKTDWGDSLGELHSSIRSMAESAMTGAAFIRQMRRGQWANAARTLGLRPANLKAAQRNLANHWLAYSYGWRPLAQTMFDTQKVFAEITHRTTRAIEGNGHASESGTVAFTYNGLREQGDWRGGVHCKLTATLDNPFLRSLNQLGLTNPATVLWEVTPFSFVVDWFLPVGNTLQAMTAGQGLTWHGGQITKRIQEQIVISHITGKETDWVDVVDGGFYAERSESFQRVALAGFPYARFYANLHPFGGGEYYDKKDRQYHDSSFATSRALNALALVRQLKR